MKLTARFTEEGIKLKMFRMKSNQNVKDFNTGHQRSFLLLIEIDDK